MQNYKHLLLTTDLSRETDKIADHALAIAKKNNAKLSLIHVVEHTPVVYGGGEFSVPLDINLEDALRGHAQQALAALGRRLGIPEEDQFTETGSIKKAVISLAERLGVDLIVTGTHGRHGVERILGSTANAILHLAKCDVLTVRVD